VLVEKPLAPSAESVNRLIHVAKLRGCVLAAGHVFQFAEYLKNFSIAVHSSGTLNNLKITWEDPRFEMRLGELKAYDSSIPVFMDCLPHALSLLTSLLSLDRLLLERTQFRRGGAEVEIFLQVNNISVIILLARDAAKRQRLIEATLQDGKRVVLDFQHEPGLILSSSGTVVADPNWEMKPRPLSMMLLAFISGVSRGDWDARLSPEFALTVAKLTDQVKINYYPQLIKWTKTMLRDIRHEQDRESLIYALRELLQIRYKLSESILEYQISECLKKRTVVCN
jgi:hypothetical protein